MKPIKRGYRYQLMNKPVAGNLWLVLDTECEYDGLYEIAGSELSRAAARARANELNDRRGTGRAVA